MALHTDSGLSSLTCKAYFMQGDIGVLFSWIHVLKGKGCSPGLI